MTTTSSSISVTAAVPAPTPHGSTVAGHGAPSPNCSATAGRNMEDETNNSITTSSTSSSRPPAAAGPALSLQDNTALIQGISTQVAAALEVKLAKFSETLECITARLEKNDKRMEEAETRMDEAETRISSAEDDLNEMKLALTKAEKTISMLVQKADAQESRSKRGNITVSGLRERFEGSQPLTFFESWLPTVLNLQTKNGTIKLDRAHRIGGLRSDKKPRMVIMKLHNFTDKIKIMTAFKAQRPITVDGEAFVIRADIPANITKQRRCFNDVCSHLIKRNIEFRMIFPATLSFTHEGSNYAFSKAEEAQALINSWGATEEATT